MKKFFLGLIVLIVLMIGGAFLAIKFIPVETIQKKALAEISASTGFDIKIDGIVDISLFPPVAVEVPSVTVEKKGQSKPLLRAERIDLNLSLIDLLFGKVNVKRLDIVKADVYLEYDKKGTLNWAFLEQKEDKKYKKTHSAHTEGHGSETAYDLSVDHFKVESAKITYVDKRAGTHYVMSDANFDFDMPGQTKPAKLNGDFMYHNVKSTISGKVDKAMVFMIPNADSNAKITFENKFISADFQGKLANLKVDPKVTGHLNASGSDLGGLLSWVSGTPNQGTFPIKSFSRNGTIEYHKNILKADPVKVKLDDIVIDGNGVINLKGEKPHVTFNLKSDKINLDGLIKQAGIESDNLGGGVFFSTAYAAPPASDAIDLSALQAFDGVINYAINSVSYKGFNMGAADVKSTINGGRMKGALALPALFDGHAALNWDVIGKMRNSDIQANWKLTNVNIHPFLKMFADFERIEGNAVSQGKIHTKGHTTQMFKQNLNGSGDFKVLNGALRGVNLGALSRNIFDVFSDRREKTDFSELSSTYTISQGRLQTSDLKMLAPIVRMTGQGWVDIALESMDMRIDPKVVASTKGIGGKFDLSGLTVPFRIHGPWSHLKYTPEIGKAIENKVKEQLQNLGKSGKGGKAGKIIDQLLGGGGDQSGQEVPPPSDQTTDQPAADPLDALKSIFGK